ncbi:class I SAM-dependent methyltransferase [Azospirillum sp. TSH58]|uniref:methyltransferase domain-containing protein n=1 Tax=Azospirillum sp. TSH58 TaxID=664962 RepID=UPI000D68A015|nr:class I SAM-dependent methyltransferase [Azospirillum sp. TSH58]
MINLDFRPHRKDGLQATLWEFHMGLRAFEADSVDGITISHMMMYVPISQYHEFFKDCFRVLKRGGVLRVTEDNANLHGPLNAIIRCRPHPQHDAADAGGSRLPGL